MAGSILTAAEFNRAQALVAKMLGVGEGDYGYNQPTLNGLPENGVNSSPAAPAVSADLVIALRKDILMLAYHQVGTTIPSTKTIPEIVDDQITSTISDRILLATIGARSAAGSLPSTPNGWLLPGRTTMVQKGNRVIRDTKRTITMTEDWNSTSTHTVTVTFEDANAMRCYFNAGSTIEFTPSKSGTTSAKNTKWVTLFSTIGTLIFQRNSTLVSKTKTTTINPGYDKLAASAAAAIAAAEIDPDSPNAVDKGITIFKKSTSTESYAVNAVIDGTNTIIFTSTFSNTGLNVTGTLTTTVKAFYSVLAEGDDPLQHMAIPSPVFDSSYTVGDPNPSFSIARSPSLLQLTETGTTNSIVYTFTATNFVGDEIYYSIIKDIISKPPSASDIVIEDFIDIPLSGSRTLVSTGSSKTATVQITINADATTEGLDKFDIEFRATDNADDPVLTSIKAAFGRTVNIVDTSTTPKVLARTLRFGTVTTGKIPTYTVGTKVLFTIIGANLIAPRDLVTWKIRTVPGTTRGLTSDDFQEGLENSFNMPVDQRYTLELNIVADAKFDALERFQVDLYLTDPVTEELIPKPAATSYVVQITSTVEIIQAPYAVLPPSAFTMEENGKVGISIPFTTPYLAPTAARVWYEITAADPVDGISTKNKIEATDFTDKLIKGSCPVTVRGNAGSGTLKKIAAADSVIEGTEGFIVTFYKDKDYTDSFGETDPIRITETAGYTVDVSSRSMREPLPTGTTSTGKLPYSITFTLKTPYIENDPETPVHWEVIPISPAPSGGIGVFTEDDFEEGIEGDTIVVDNKVVLKLTAKNDGMTEGVEQFYVRFTLTVNDVDITKDSPTVLVTETVAYSIARIENSPSNVNEQPTGTTEGFEYVIKTPYLPPNTPIYWEVIPADKTSVFEKTDFTIGQYSGQIIINQNGVITNEATLSLVPVVDTKIEGSESFYVIVKTSPSKFSEVARTLQADTISENFKPTIYAASKSLTEGATGLTFNIAVPKNPVGTKVFWKITKGSTGTITPSDFSVTDAVGKNRQAISGHVLIDKNSTAVLSIAARKDAVTNSSAGTEDEEKFIVSIGMDDSASAASTDEISITDVSSYIVTADVVSVVETEGSLLGSGSRTANFGVYTPFFPEGKTLYYTVRSIAGTVNTADFIQGKVQDTFQVYGNYAKLPFTIKPDSSTAEGNEKFCIEIRETGFSSPVVPGGISPGVLIYDTSVNVGLPIDDTEISATITSLDNKMEYTEGDTMNLRISTVGVLHTDALNWSTFSFVSGGIGQYLSAAQSTTSLSVNGTATAASVDVTITVNTTVNNEGSRPFIFQVHKGAIATDPIGFAPFVIKDKVAYSVEPVGNLINESGTAMRFNVVTPTESYNSTLKWQIESEGLGISATDFNVPSQYNFNTGDSTGEVTINASGTGFFTLSAATDAETEGTEKFRIKLWKFLGAGLGWAPIPNVQSSVVNISDLVDYTLTPTAAGMTNYTVSAGTIVTYTLTTPKLVSSTMSSPWTVSLTGSVATAPASFPVNTTDTNYTFTVTTKSNITSNGSFNVKILRANGSQVNPVVPPPPITVTAPLVYLISATKKGTTSTTISETDTLTVSVQSSTTPVYWYIAQDRPEESTTPPIDAYDFPSTRPSSGTVNSKLESFDLRFDNPQRRTTGIKKFHLFLSLTPPGTPLPTPIPGAETVTITKTQPAVYTITPSTTKVVEGFPVTFTVTTPFISSNVLYKWQVVPVSGSITTVTAASPATQDSIGSLTGQFTINSATNSGTVTITVPATPADDTRTYQLKISDDNSAVVIPTTDTTKNPIITVGSNVGYAIIATASATSTTPITSIMEGGSITFKVTRPTASTISKIKWEVSKDEISGSDFLTTHVTSTTGIGTFNSSGEFTFTVTTKIDSPLLRNNNANRKFKIKLYDNTITNSPSLLTNTNQSDITITDYEYLSVTDNGVLPPGGNSPVIREGTTGTGADADLPYSITFTVIAKPADEGSHLNYEITGNVTATNFGIVSLKSTTGLVTLNTTGPYNGLYTVDFTLTTVADSITNTPARTFSVKFTRSRSSTGIAATNTCESRIISIKDTSTTFTPPPYLITDTGLPVIPAKTVSINESNVITFTVHALVGDTGPMYYSIRPAIPRSIKAGELIKAGDTLPLTSLEGSVPITNQLATLTLTTVADKLDNSLKSKGFFVVFSKTVLGPSTKQTDTNLISRSVTVVDTSKPDVVAPTITHTLSETPTGCFVLPNTTFYVESKITPITAVTPMTWRISGEPKVLQKIKYKGITVVANTTYTENSKSTNRLGATLTNCHFLSLTLTVDNVLDTEDICGLFKITISVSQPTGDVTVSADINLQHLAKPITIKSSGPFPANFEDIKVQGIEHFVVTLAGARGENGNQRGPGWDAGYGAPGDIVTGIIPATSQIYFNFFSGGPGGNSRGSWTLPAGGDGGDGVAVYSGTKLPVSTQPPYATAAGGGGGGSGWADSSSVAGSTGASPTVTASYSPSNVATPQTPNDGCGGTGGGTVLFQTQGINDNNDSRDYRLGGLGGVSFVPAYWHRKAGANFTQSAYATVALAKKCSTQTNQPLQFIDAGVREVIVPAGMNAVDLILVGAGGGGGGAGGTPISVSNVTYPIASTFTTNLYDYSGYNRFGIYGGLNTFTTDKAPVLATINKTLTLMTFRTPFLAPPKLTSYTLFYQGLGKGSVVIEKKTYSFTGTGKLQAQTVQLGPNFTRLITVSATLTNTLYKLVSGSYVSPNIGSGSVGINALFDVTITAAGYSIIVASGNGGSKYTTGEQLKILGTSVGGSTPANDILFYVTAVDSKGKITKIGPPLAGYGTSAKPYGIAAWLVPSGNDKLYDPAIHPESWLNTDTNGKYKESDILWSTRMPCSVVIDNAGKSNGSSGAGGGAGSIVSTRTQVTPGETLVISVGAGGAGGLAQDHDTAATRSTAGSAGTATTLTRNGTVIATANGGGGGGTFNYVIPPVAAIPGAAGGAGTVATGLTNSGSVGTGGVKGITTGTNTIGDAKGGLGGNNLSSYGKGSPGGSIDESTQDTFFTDGDRGADGYICIAWRPDSSLTEYACNATTAVLPVDSISNVVMKCSHYSNGEGKIQVTFKDVRWSTNVASYTIWYTSVGLGPGYPTTEYFLTEILKPSNGTVVASTERTNVWVTTFTGSSSMLTSGTLRIAALNSSKTILYFKTVTATFTTTSFSTTNSIEYVYTFNFS